MDLLHPQLAAFAAVLEEGSFEAAARRLCITPSAVSQRIKALEDRLGQVLLVRQPPCRPTPAGALLLRRVRPMQLLEAEALADFLPEKNAHHPGAALRPIPIAVNSDSLDTWVLGALAQLHQQHGYLFDVQVDEPDHTLDLLRDGSVLGVVTADGVPVQGCTVQALGAMRYRAVAAPEFAARRLHAGVNAASAGAAPIIVFNRKDALQWRFVRRITRARWHRPCITCPRPPVLLMPQRWAWAGAWPRTTLVQPALQAGRVVCIDPERWLDVPLHWQHAAVRSDDLATPQHGAVPGRENGFAARTRAASCTISRTKPKEWAQLPGFAQDDCDEPQSPDYRRHENRHAGQRQRPPVHHPPGASGDEAKRSMSASSWTMRPSSPSSTNSSSSAKTASAPLKAQAAKTWPRLNKPKWPCCRCTCPSA